MGAECCDKDRGQMRREQVLTAAAACFQRHGFHGASMAQISREAGMSVGHIYHYFANKEAIIAAIVAGDQQQILAIDDEIRSHEDWARAMVEHVPRGLERAVEGRHATRRWRRWCARQTKRSDARSARPCALPAVTVTGSAIPRAAARFSRRFTKGCRFAGCVIPLWIAPQPHA